MAVESGTVQVVMPAMGDSVAEGTVLEWHKAVGDQVKLGETVKQGDTVVEISTDKVDMELPAPVSGTLVEALADEGDTVTVGQVIGRMNAVAAEAVAPEVRESDGKAFIENEKPSTSA